MKAYFARPISLYNTKQDLRDLEILQKLGFDVVNPNKEELYKKYEKEGMSVFLECLKDCDIIVFRSFQDNKISAGVFKEIQEGASQGKIILELPTITSNRILSVDDTRLYLQYLGHR